MGANQLTDWRLPHAAVAFAHRLHRHATVAADWASGHFTATSFGKGAFLLQRVALVSQYIYCGK
jgi:hypothetical protein